MWQVVLGGWKFGAVCKIYWDYVGWIFVRISLCDCDKFDIYYLKKSSNVMIVMITLLIPQNLHLWIIFRCLFAI